MNKIYAFFTAKETIIGLIVITSIVFFLSLFNRYIYIDDAWFGEQAYWFSKLGFVKTSTIVDFYGWDERLFVYHKLNIYLLNYFGTSKDGPFRFSIH